jgi:hypothetical protein
MRTFISSLIMASSCLRGQKVPRQAYEISPAAIGSKPLALAKETASTRRVATSLPSNFIKKHHVIYNLRGRDT